MSTFICDKCRTCAKFPFCGVKESLDGNCSTYLKRIKPVEIKYIKVGEMGEYRR